MELKTENLAILLTDIAGFTETTIQQSRLDNERLIDTHSRLLLPLIRRFRGRLVKTIGDAFLIVFKSPTDAMLCAMAMQDALFAHNRNEPPERQIHIRIAASLGEVRVTRNDIFGEPVNMTSRIEGITPADEIYFSEAMYMAMNKAEVPSQEVGWRELKGVAQPVRIYQIPRFGNPRLVAADAMSTQDMNGIAFPYGGAHLSKNHPPERFFEHATHLRIGALRLFRTHGRRAGLTALAIAALTGVALATLKFWPRPHTAEPVVADARPPAQGSSPAATPKPEPQAKPPSKPPPVTPRAEPATRTLPAPRAAEPAAPRPAPAPAPVEYTSLRAAKAAYRNNKLSKSEYRRVVGELRARMEAEEQALKNQYRGGHIDKREYKRAREALQRKYD